MRPSIAFFAALASTWAVAAHAAEDRYGPARAAPTRMASNSATAAYQGRLLTWSSRAFTPQTPEAAPAPALQAPQAPPVAIPAKMVRAPVAPAALPDSLYSPPPAPRRVAQAAPAPAAPEGAAPNAHVRLYSVHRQYGMAPDAIPAPSKAGSNYVLIGANDDAGRSASSEKPDNDGPF